MTSKRKNRKLKNKKGGGIFSSSNKNSSKSQMLKEEEEKKREQIKNERDILIQSIKQLQNTDTFKRFIQEKKPITANINNIENPHQSPHIEVFNHNKFNISNYYKSLKSNEKEKFKSIIKSNNPSLNLNILKNIEDKYKKQKDIDYLTIDEFFKQNILISSYKIALQNFIYYKEKYYDFRNKLEEINSILQTGGNNRNNIKTYEYKALIERIKRQKKYYENKSNKLEQDVLKAKKILENALPRQ